MRNSARPILTRLVLVQTGACASTGLLVVAFAPRLLLMDPAVVDGSMSIAFWGWLISTAVVIAVTLISTWRLWPVLDRLAAGIASLQATDVLALDAVPVRVVGFGLVATGLVVGATLLPAFRPETNDIATQGELVLLTMTLASVAALPAYVAARAAMAGAMELAPAATSRDAIELLDHRGSSGARVRQRLLAAVVAPVAFVALGASLLVQAHLRAFDASSLEDEAADLAMGVFDAPGDPRGRVRAAEAAKPLGFDVRIEAKSAPFEATRDADGTLTVLSVPLTEGHAVVRFPTAQIGPATGYYLGLSLAAIAVAALLGWRIGSAFADDVALATSELEATGVADVLRGGHIRGDARFGSVAALMRAADELGGVFREFASAQQRAIDARTGTERMRGLFLASMSHDLKAPLNAILGFAALVSQGPLSEAQRESVGIIEQRGRELLYLIDTILDSARVEAGELTMSPEWARIDDVVTSAVLEARDLAVGLDVDITGEIQPGVPRVFVDASRLAQALKALILVATRFADHGHVVVRGALPAVEERLRIDVEVTGRVIAAADRKKVFDAFTQADRARRHGSLGLGPALARAIVGMHGGGIDVETTEAGGTVFHMWVPSERPSRAPLAW
ncbi:MAG TPA: HAMP domain-containing sensor histidine kinase [Polyangiaceae bacterium]